MPLIEHIADTSLENVKANVTEIKMVEEVAVASMNKQKQTTSSFGAPVGSQEENKVPALEVGARVWITGGSYKANYGTVEKVMKVKVQVNIDGLGSKRPEIKNVMVVGKRWQMIRPCRRPPLRLVNRLRMLRMSMILTGSHRMARRQQKSQLHSNKDRLC